MLLVLERSNSLLLCGPHDKGARILQRLEQTNGVVMAWLNLGDNEGMNGRRRGQGIGHGAVKKPAYSKRVIGVGV